MNLDILPTIIEGGVVGLMALGMVIAARIAMKLITVGQSLITNHLGELTDEVRGVREALVQLTSDLRNRE
jgi:hypothetical protein